jgi:hypothetical protein
MSPKEKATELGNKFYRGDIFTHGKEAHLIELEQARKYALLCVDELIESHLLLTTTHDLEPSIRCKRYWQRVKEELIKL